VWHVAKTNPMIEMKRIKIKVYLVMIIGTAKNLKLISISTLKLRTRTNQSL